MALFRASDGSGSSTLVFSPESQTCSLYITAGGAIVNSTGPSKRILFEVRLTHPDYMIATPRDGSLLSSGDEEVIVVLQLVNTQNLDLALLTEAPMRVMIIGTTSGQHSDPPVTQKLKLLCDSDSIRRSCAVLASANNKGVGSSMESLGDAKGRSGGMGASTPRSAAPAPVLERKASGNQLSTMSPPPSSSSASVLTAAPSRVTPPTTAPPPQAVVPPLPTAAEGASPPPRQLVVGTTKGSGNATATTANTFDYSHYDVPSGDATKFQLMMTLHRLVFPEGSVSMPHQTGMLCCIQWKRLTSSGVTGWHRVERPAGSSSSLVCSLEDEIIDVPNCDVSLEKRVTLALGIVTVDEGRPTETFLRGTLKLDTSKPLENNTSSSSTSEQTAAVFPLTIDGKGGATLVATLVTRTEARHVLVDQTPIKTVDPSSRSDTPTTQKTLSSSDPTMVSPATAGAAAAPMLDETPRSRTAATVAGATGSKYADPLSSLSALKMQIESLEAMRPPLPPPSSSSTSSVPSPMFNASVSGMGGASSPLMPADIATNPLRSFEKQMPKSSNVQVAVRIRPTLPFESPSQKPVWTYDTRAIRSTANDREYQYDYVFAPDTTTKGVFDALCPPFVDNALLGINGTIFMYGQTASGKTHTMFGGEKEAGITPKVIEHLFQEIQKKKAEESNVQVNVSACYFEIYNEELNDLLDMSKKNLQIRSSGAADGGFTVDVSSFPVASAEEALQVLLHGSYNKKVGQSHLNDRSSRSHSIFKLGIEVVTFDPLIKVGSGTTKASKGIKTTAELCLVDLAGSETLQDKGGASQRKETTNINLSLTYLKKVIWELAHKEKHVSYRNSTLTKVLKQAIGGNSRTCVVCCITPAEEHYRDSRNTLVFGTTAKSVVTTTRVNTSGDANAESEKLKMEMSRLRAQLEAYEATVTAYARIEDDFRKVLQENAAFAEQVERLEAENAELRQNASMFGSTSEDTALRRGEQQRPPAAGTESQSTGDGEGDEDDAHAPRAAPRFTIPNVTASRASAVLRADAVQHAALLEEAISRLADATDGADLDTTLTQEAGPDSSALDERALDEDDLFDEVDAHSAASGTPRTASVGPSNAGASSGDASKLVSSTNRPPAPKRRPPAVKTERPNLANATVAVPRTVESLQLQLVQQTIDHRSEMLKKEDEIRRILEQQVRPTDEIPEIMKKEEKVCVLLDQLHSFLHHGTPMTVVTTVEAPLAGLDSGSMVGAKLPKQAPRFSRVFMYLYTFNQTFLCFCHVDSTDPKLPKRSSCFEKIPIKDIKRVELGQYSDSFEKLKTWTATNNNEGDVEYAETCKKVQSRHRMSFSVVVKKGRSFDLVCEDEADFEAWVIELNRLLGTSAEWKHSLDISEMEFFDALEPEEKKFCASMHVHPDEYIRAKTKMLKRKEKFVTLFDVRSLAQFDLYHSQRFFYFLRCQGWVSQAALFYLTDKFVASAQADLDVL